MKLQKGIIVLASVFVGAFVGLANTEDSSKSFFANLNLYDLDGKNGFKFNYKGKMEGCLVRAAGDINGDGLGDSLIGGASLIFVVFGNREWPETFDLSSLNGTNGFAVNTNNNYNSLGTAGDVNGDGIDDFLIGSFGQTYVIFGSKKQWPTILYLSNMDGNNGCAINGTGGAIGSGFSVGKAGDVNYDGVGDILIGAYKISYVVFGKKGAWPPMIYLTNLNGTNGFIVNQDDYGVVSGAGDINADGIDDIMISYPSLNGRNALQSFVIFGRKEPWPKSINVVDLNGSNGFTMKEYNPNNFPTSIVTKAGDVNQDGIADILIGGKNTKSFVVFGHNGSWPAIITLTNLTGKDGFVINCKDVGSFAFTDGSGVEDVNGDNISDILLSAPNANGNVGQNYIIFGSNKSWPKALNVANINGTNGFVIDGYLQVETGCSVSGAGDVNGDGINDYLIGAMKGQGYLVFGATERASPPNDNSVSILAGLFGGISAIALGVVVYYIYQYCRDSAYVLNPPERDPLTGERIELPQFNLDLQ